MGDRSPSMRQLKRNCTVLIETGDANTEPAPPPTPCKKGAMPQDDLEWTLPRLPFPSRKEHAAMDPPLPPPARKKATRTSVTQRGGCRPPPMPQSPRSPVRMLTPRVSWSEILTCSQESLDDEQLPRSPRTPLFRIRRPASPPQRAAWRRRPLSEDEGGDDRDLNEGHFQRMFCDVTAIGKGQFSTVYKARNRTDQCFYAVKKTTQISRGQQRTQLREVFTLANVSKGFRSEYIVQYYSSWFEDERLHIQTELCACSLRDRMVKRRTEAAGDPRFGETDLVEVVHHVGTGLKILHASNIVHLDIKPDNILVSFPDAGRELYKIADLGLAAAAIGCGCDDICEGDCRYLAKEVLRGDLSDLPKADVFALGLVCYEMATNPKPLPCNGDEWHRLREGTLEVDLMSTLSEGLLGLIKRMVKAAPSERPPCEEILAHPSISPDDTVEALQEHLRQKTLEAQQKTLEAEQKTLEAAQKALEAEQNKLEAQQAALEATRSRELAAQYYHEIVSMKKQELLSGQRVQPPEETMVRRFLLLQASPQPTLRRLVTR